jgi:hypothetical protein
VKDMIAYLEKLRVDATECQMLATDARKRELFAKMAEDFRVLASELERELRRGAEKRLPHCNQENSLDGQSAFERCGATSNDASSTSRR